MNQDQERKWIIKNKKIAPFLREKIYKYLESIDPLFEKAKSVSEFEFILSILGTKGVQDAGWNPWEETLGIFHFLSKLTNKFRYFEEIIYLMLWMYGLAIEANFPYELIANLINISKGKRYNINPFNNLIRKKRIIYPHQKIKTLIQMAKEINMEKSIYPFQDVFDKDLRNAIFHSDFTIYKGEVRVSIKNDFKKVYTKDEMTERINKVSAFLTTFENIILYYNQSYESPKIIGVHPNFSYGESEKAITLIRKGYGLIGLKDNWTTKDIQNGKIPWHVGFFRSYEKDILMNNHEIVVFPKDRLKKVEIILKFFPYIIKREVFNLLKKYYPFE